MESNGQDEISLVSKEEAIAEVRRWLDVEKVDPEGIFSATGDHVLRYKDLIHHLETETSDGEVLRFAISRGRVMKSERDRPVQHLLHIAPSPEARGRQPGSVGRGNQSSSEET